MPEASLWEVLISKSDNPIVFAGITLTLAYITVSKRLAEVQGPLGALARWWNNRQQRRIEREQAVWRVRYAAEDERTDARVADLTEQVEYLKQQLAETRRELREALAALSRGVALANSKLDHPSRLPSPRVGDTEPMERMSAV